MVVSDDLQQLLGLQEVDEFIADARLKQKKLPELVAAELAAFKEAEALLARAEESLAAHEVTKRAHEAELADQEAHIERLKGRLKEIANTREYQAHIQEMDGVQKAISDLEDQILQSLADVETVTEEIATLRAEFEERQSVYNAERAKVDKELARLETEVRKHLATKDERAKQVGAPLLRRYERISRSLRRAVVAVENGTCAGCRMNVPPQLVSEVKRGKGIHQCPHCQRLLYVPAVPVAEAAE